jgi:hypothetical protein
MLVYTTLFFSQAIYPETYESNPWWDQPSKAKQNRLTKWVDPIQEWIVDKVTRTGDTIDHWTHTCQGQCKLCHKRAISIRMQRPAQAGDRMITKQMMLATTKVW